jgi:zinc-ribbon domain
MDLCPYCGKDLPDGAVKCLNCGRDLKTNAGEFQMHKVFATVIVFIMIFSIVLMFLNRILSGGGNGGGNTTADYSCIVLRIDNIIRDESPIKVVGTITNNCRLDIKEADIQTTCFSPSGTVIDQDVIHMENHPIHSNPNYESLIQATSDEVDRCSSEVMSARFGTIK